MIRARTRGDAEHDVKVFKSNDFCGRIHYYFEDLDGPRPSPQVFLVQQDPNIHLPTHFHRQYQFQVVVHGSGTIGRKHRLSPFCVHYVSAESAYGPIVSGNEGLWYFTIRAVSEHGAYMLPQERKTMRKGLKKSHHISVAPSLSDAEAIQARREAAIDTVIEPRDGLAAWFLRVPPGADVARPTAAGNGGNFYVVAGGTMRIGDKVLPRLGVAFASADEPDFRIQAGEEGLEVLALQFPAAALIN